MSIYFPKFVNLGAYNQYISSVSEKAVPASGDLILIEDSEDGYAKKYVQIANLPVSGGAGSQPSGIITVAKAGGDYTSIQDGMNSASAGQTVLVYPGTYNENITTDGVAAGVRVTGFPNALNCIISPLDHDSPTVTITKNFTLREITVYSPNGGNGSSAIECNELATGSLVPIVNVPIIGQNTGSNGFSGCGGGTVAVLQGFFHNGGNLNNFVETNDGKFIGESFIGNLGSCSNFIKSNSGVSKINSVVLRESGSYDTNCTINFNSGSLKVNNIIADEINPASDIGLRISGDGGRIDLQASHLQSKITDILIDASLTGAGTEISLNAVDYRNEKLVNNSNQTWQDNVIWTGTHLDVAVQNDAAFRVITELSVGRPERPRESNFGTGDSVVRGMYIYTDDGTGTNFTNVTSEAKSLSGSSFSPQGTGSGEAVVYYGTDLNLRPTDIKINLETTGTLGSGSYVGEIYNGSSWTEINYMITSTSGSRQQFGKSTYSHLNHRIRLDCSGSAYQSWTKNDPGMGQSAYWFRLRNTGSVDSVPSIERVKIGYNRTQIDGDGLSEYMGNARPYRAWWTGNGETMSVPAGGANGASTLSLTISSNITYNQQRSSYAGNQINSAGTQITIPDGIDTSSPITCEIHWITTGTSTNAVQWVLYAGIIEQNDTLNSTVSELTPVTQSVSPTSGIANTTLRTAFDFDISNSVPGDTLAFVLKRNGPTDLNNDAAGVLSIEWKGYFWK